MNAGDVAWVSAATALVMLMTPALGFFYGGLVRKKNLVSTLVQCVAIFAVVSLVWTLWGYTLVFGPSIHGFIGDLSYAGLLNVGITTTTSYAPDIPLLLFFAFQLKFAAITPALIIGAFAERINFRSLLVFIVLWSTVIYCPIAHWVWNSCGWLHSLGAVDFAGGTVVHIAAGLSALAAALVIGRRNDLDHDVGKRRGSVTGKRRGKDSDISRRKGSLTSGIKGRDVELNGNGTCRPNNIPFVILGAALLLFGWFGFNAGSALAANELSVSALVVTNLAAAAAAVSWMFVEWVTKGKPSAVGLSVGAVCGLVAITPASGYVSVSASIVIGLVAGVLSNVVARWRAARTRIDDSLDVFACHGISGIWGSLATGLFASTMINNVNGFFYGNPNQLIVQLIAVVVVVVYAFVGSFVLLKAINVFTRIRVSPREERDGLDKSQHGEEAYGYP